jgi:hypothetical protein
MIALAVVRHDDNGKIIDPPGVEDGTAFNATCPICKNRLSYASYEVTHWEGPLPTSDFVEHASFVPLPK